MKRSYVSTLVLLVVCLALIAWYALYEKKYKKTQVESEEKQKQLITLDKDQIQEIKITWNKNAPDKEGASADATKAPDYVTLRLKKTGKDWNLVEPIEDSADGPTMTSLITNLATTKQERVVDEKPKDLTEYGLKPPVVSVEVKKDSTTPAQQVDLGTSTPVGFSVYAKTLGSDTVFRVAKSFRTGFEKEVKAFRNKNVFSLSRFEVGEVEITQGKDLVLLKKDEKENWILARENVPAESGEVTGLLNALVDLKAQDFVSEDGKDSQKFGLASPKYKVQLTRSKDKGRVGLWVGVVKDDVYVKREDKPNVYKVDKGLLQKLERPEGSYRSKELAIFNRFDVKRVKLQHGKEMVELLKEDAGWSFPAEPASKVDGAKVDAFLTRVQDGKIVKYLPPTAAAKTKDPQYVVHLFEKKDGKETEKVVLSFGKAQGKEVPVSRDGLSIPFTVSEEEFNKLVVSKRDFIKTETPPEAKKDAEKKG